MKGYEFLARALARHGIEVVFGLPGDGNMFFDTRLTAAGVRYVKAVREDGAVMMANAYARLSRKPGFASVTLGPGLTNTVTALTTSARERNSVVVLTGQAPRGDPGYLTGHLQAIDQRQVVAATGADLVSVRDAESLVSTIDTAIAQAVSERRPVVVAIPLDVQQGTVGVSAEATLDQAPPPQVAEVQPTDDALEQAVGVIVSCQRPLVLAGSGVELARARPALLKLADRIGAVVGTSLGAKDLFRGEPYDLGVVGTLASDVAIETISSVNCIVAFGASLNQFTTAFGSLAEGKAVVHCDVDAGAIGRTTKVAAGIVGDAGAAATGLLGYLDTLGHRSVGMRTEALSEGLAAARRGPAFDDRSSLRGIDARMAMTCLASALPPHYSTVVDAGHFMGAVWNFFPISDPSAFVNTVAFGSIGLGLAAAVGTACARPDQPVAAFVGDGGLMMSLGELTTIVRHDFDVIVVVINDRCYGAEYHSLRLANEDTQISLFDWPSIAEVARAIGLPSITACSLDDFATVSAFVSGRTGPVLVEVVTDPSVVTGFRD